MSDTLHRATKAGIPACYTRLIVDAARWSREVGASPTRSRHCKRGADRHSGDLDVRSHRPGEIARHCASGTGRRGRPALIRESGDLAFGFALATRPHGRVWRVVTPEGVDARHPIPQLRSHL